MSDSVQGIRYRNLDEARAVLRSVRTSPDDGDPFEDGGREPEGLLAVITEDLVGEEVFYRLFDAGKGTLVQVVRRAYSGFGPPAREPDYMGFVSRRLCYILDGAEVPVRIEGCPQGAEDIHHLELLILDGDHDLDGAALARRLNLPEEWDFDDLFELIAEGELTGTQIDQMIHRGAGD